MKIDRSFTSAVGTGGKEESIIVNIMPLAQNLGLDVVAEGVETNEQASFLRQLRCKYAQGYLFSRPVNAVRAGELLQKPLIPVEPDVSSPRLQSRTQAWSRASVARNLNMACADYARV